VDNEGKVTGTKCLESNETNGVEGTLDGKFNTMTLDTLTVDIISSSTKTCEGYRDAVKAALQAQIICSGGSVDIRDPEQILQDNCNAALGTEGLTFKKWFAVEEITGVDALYLPDNAEGAVAKVGELFVGVNANGEVVTPGDEFADITEAVQNAYAIYSASVLTEITLPNSVTAMGEHAFYACYALTSVNLGSGLASIGQSAFRSCSALTEITVPDSVTAIGEDAFYDCSALAVADLGNGVEAIGKSTFRNCRALTAVTLPNSLATIDQSAFANCSTVAVFSYCVVDEPCRTKESEYLLRTSILHIVEPAFLPASCTIDVAIVIKLL
jgi:hypothetical protein